MAARQTRRQLQFSSFEAGVIGAVFAVTVSAVFFCGLFVGKRNAALHAPAEDRVARVPVDDFTRYKRPAPLEKPVREPKPAATEAPVAVASASGTAPAPAAVAAPAATPAAAKSPAGPAGPAFPVGPAAPAPAADAAAKGAKPDAAAAAAKDQADAAKAKEAAAKEAAAKEAATKKAAADKLAAEKAAKEKESAESETGKGYTVQILATRKQAEADALVQKLKSRGYAAYIKRVSNGGEVYYRVRVGSYGAFSEAKGMADKCRRDMSLGQAFVSTE